jgi:hypothetical protein
MKGSRSVCGATFAVIALAATAGCGGDHPILIGDIRSVTATLSAGECLGYCRWTTEVWSDLRARYSERSWREDAMYPPKDRSFELLDREWATISDRVAQATELRWEPQYGCPDCMDQGAWQLSIETSAGETRTTRLDGIAGFNPDWLWRVIEALGDLHPESR